MMMIDLDKAAQEFESVSYDNRVFYNTETGEFKNFSLEGSDEDEDDDGFLDDCWIAAPSQWDINEYAMMGEFKDAVTNNRKKELLGVALEGKGAFRRFKDTLHRVDLVDEWYEFKRLAYIEVARIWCDQNGLDYDSNDKAGELDAHQQINGELGGGGFGSGEFGGGGLGNGALGGGGLSNGGVSLPLSAIDAIHARYSCRAFSDRMPKEGDLLAIAKAALAAPSGMNRQLWRIVILTNKALIAEMDAEGMRNLEALPDKSIYGRIMSRGGKIFYGAPCMIVVPTGISDPEGAGMFDCGIVAQNIALAATSLGVDNLICGLAALAFAGEKGDGFKKRLAFPAGYEIGIAVLLGYALEPGGMPHEPDMAKLTIVK